jgi:RimJ/RimL family protein N-acetyltransferase
VSGRGGKKLRVPPLLRRLEASDQVLLNALNSDQAVIDYLGSVGYKPDDATTRLRVVLVGAESVGVLGLVGEGKPHFICALLPSFRGDGNGSQACVRFMDAVREEGHFSRVFATIAGDNHGGLKLAKSLGFRPTGKFRYNVSRDEQDEVWDLCFR